MGNIVVRDAYHIFGYCPSLQRFSRTEVFTEISRPRLGACHAVIGSKVRGLLSAPAADLIFGKRVSLSRISTTCCILQIKITPSVVLFPLHSIAFLVFFRGFRLVVSTDSRS